jgi:uncharacterized protein YegP (UPF0339 family)
VKFLIDSADGERFQFTLLASDGHVVATGCPCTDKGEVLAGIAAMMQDLADARIEDRTTSSGGTDGRVPATAAIGRPGYPPPI